MKKLFILFAFIPFVAVAQDIGQPEGLFTDQLVYTIYDQNGVVIDQTTYDRKVGIPFREVMYLKYIRVARCMGKDAQTFVEIDEEFGNAVKTPGALSKIKSGEFNAFKNIFLRESGNQPEKQ